MRKCTDRRTNINLAQNSKKMLIFPKRVINNVLKNSVRFYSQADVKGVQNGDGNIKM